MKSILAFILMKLIFDYPGTKGAIIGFGTQATDELTFVTKLA